MFRIITRADILATCATHADREYWNQYLDSLEASNDEDADDQEQQWRDQGITDDYDSGYHRD